MLGPARGTHIPYSPSNTEAILDGQGHQAADIHKQIQADRSAYREDPRELITFREYCKGKHTMVLTPKQQLILRNLIGRKFCDNVCHQIVAEAVDRIDFRGWSSPEDPTIQQWLDDFYIIAQIKKKEGPIIYDALRDGNTAISLNWDEETQSVCVYREEWWDGYQGCFIGYDSLDRPYYAVKDWKERRADLIQLGQLPPVAMWPGVYGLSGDPGAGWTYEDNVLRRIIWFADRLERWISFDGGISWKPYQLPEDEGNWPIPWLDAGGKPLGLPFIHFANGGRGTGNYGLSEIDGGIVGFNDQLNDLQWAMSAAGRLTAFQMMAISGIRTEKDVNGNDVQPEVGPGAVFHSSSDKTRFQVLPAGDMSQLIKLYDKKLGRIAQMSRTPYHLIGGEWPSGDAILRAEKPAVGKADRQIAGFGEGWIEVARMAIRIHNRFSTGEDAGILETSPRKAALYPMYGSTERRDPLSNSLIVNNLTNFISPHEALRIMDYSSDDAQKIIDEKMNYEMQLAAQTLGPGEIAPAGGTSSDPSGGSIGANGSKTPNTNGQGTPQGRNASIVIGKSKSNKPAIAKGNAAATRTKRAVYPGVNT